MAKINLKKINRELCRRLTAFTLATTMVFSSVPKVSAKDDIDVCMEVQTIMEYGTVGGDYKVVKYSDNSLKITLENARYTDTLTISSDGEVEITTYNSKYLGLFTDVNKEKFNINNFDGESIDIYKDCIESDYLNRCVSSIEEYINSNRFNDQNYIATFGENLVNNNIYGLDMKQVKEVTKSQYNDTYVTYLNDLNNNGVSIKQAGGATLVVGAALAGTLNAGSLSFLSSIVCPEVILFELAVLSLYAAEVYINDGQVLSLDDINEYTIDNIDEKASPMDQWIVLSEAETLEKVKNNYNDDDPNNDYYRAIIFNENKVYIDFNSSLSFDEAVQKIKKYNVEQFCNIYTYTSQNAINVIGGAGYIAGPSKGGLENMNKAECHAYLQSYKYFDPIEMIFDQSKLKINYNASPGVYYWHYHILGKRVDNRINGVHVFFGFPVFVKEEDIIKNLSEFNYDNFRINDSYVNLVGDYSSVNKFVKIKNLKKREGLDENKEFKV